MKKMLPKKIFMDEQSNMYYIQSKSKDNVTVDGNSMKKKQNS